MPAATAYAQAHDGSVHAENTDAHLRALGLDHRAELRRAHALLGNLQAASALPSAVATDLGTVLDQLLVTGVRLPREPLPALNTYSLVSRRQLTAQNAVYGTAVRLESVLLSATARGRASVRDMAVAAGTAG